MGCRGGRGLTWSIRHGAPGGYANRVLGDLVASCLGVCGAHLPEESGYEIRRSCLSGPIEGISLRVRRGTFRATISIQRFQRSMPSAENESQGRTLRLVAIAHHALAPDEEAQSRSAAYWTATGGATGTMAIGIVALALTGALTAWGSLLLLVPAVFGTRVCMAVWMAENMRQRALGPGPIERAQEQARNHCETRDLKRWEAVLAELQAQQQVAAERFSLRPFRGVSSGPHPIVPLVSDLPPPPPVLALKPASSG